VTTTFTHRTIAVSPIPRTPSRVSEYTHALIGALAGNALIPNPNPSIATLTDKVTKLDTAQAATKSRAHGSVATRDAARDDLVLSLHAFKGNVQLLGDANPAQAEEIFASLGWAVRKTGPRIQAPLTVKAGVVSGSVNLRAKAAAARASYDWAWSADGGKTWTEALSTLTSKTTITGLPVAMTCQFRFRSVTKAGTSDWSQVITFVVR